MKMLLVPLRYLRRYSWPVIYGDGWSRFLHQWKTRKKRVTPPLSGEHTTIYLAPTQMTDYQAVIFRPRPGRSSPTPMVRSTVRNLLTALHNLPAVQDHQLRTACETTYDLRSTPPDRLGSRRNQGPVGRRLRRNLSPPDGICPPGAYKPAGDLHATFGRPNRTPFMEPA